MKVRLMQWTLVAAFLCCTMLAFGQREVENTARFTIEGHVRNSMSVDIAGIMKYPAVAIGDMLVKNQRGEDKETVREMKGVLLRTFIDSAGINVEKHKDLNRVYIVLTASDGYKNLYSWNELFNSETGNHVYIITEIAGRSMRQMDGAILVVCNTDINKGRRHLKGLQKIEVKLAD